MAYGFNEDKSKADIGEAISAYQAENVQVYSASKNTSIGSGGINAFATGASVDVPVGTYVVCGVWLFNLSGSGVRECKAALFAGQAQAATQRIINGNSDYCQLEVTDIITVTEPTTLYVKGAASKSSSSAATTIKALKVL